MAGVKLWLHVAALAALFLLLTGGFYTNGFFLAGVADMRDFFGTLPLYLLFFIPALTMRLWAEERRQQLLMDLSLNTKAFVSQRLIPREGGIGRIAAMEIMLNTPLIADLIFKGDVGQIKDIMAKSTRLGMQTFDQALMKLYQDGTISLDDALRASCALFHIDWRDMQLSLFDQATGGYVDNVGVATSKGFEAEVRGDRGYGFRRVGLAAVDVNMMEDRAHALFVGTRSDGESQNVQGVEGVRGRHFEPYTTAIRVPLEKAIDKDAFGRQFGWAELAPVLEQTSKEDRPDVDFKIVRQLLETAHLQEGEG